MVFWFHLTPVSPGQVFALGFNCSPPCNVWSAAPSLVFRGPGESNVAVIVCLLPQDMTDPSPLADLHGFQDGYLQLFHKGLSMQGILLRLVRPLTSKLIIILFNIKIGTNCVVLTSYMGNCKKVTT